MQLRALAFLLLPLAPAAHAAGSCAVVNYSCEAPSPAVERAGRATVMIQIPGAHQCTGTLVNNGRGDNRPFILTARHCAGPAPDSSLYALAGDMEIIYGYEQACGGGPAVTKATTRGAAHRATHEDLWLVEALDPVPAQAQAYLAGLNAGGQIGSGYFGVHHGAGQPKQYIEQRVLSGNVLYLINGLLGLVISTWHTDLLQGTTPHGSSGSALFDEQSRVFGVLSDGAICAGDAKGNDYQQLASAWTGGGSAATSLRPWLDPDKRGFKVLTGKAVDIEAAPATPPPASSDGASGGGGAFGAWIVLLLGGLWRGLSRRGKFPRSL